MNVFDKIQINSLKTSSYKYRMRNSTHKEKEFAKV